MSKQNESVFKRIFGADMANIFAETPKPEIRIRLNPDQFKRLLTGKELMYRVNDDQNIRLVADAKYSRETVDQMLRDKLITQEQAEVMLRVRA